MFFKNKKINNKNGGFTLMELMVVMFVSTLILASLVIQNNKWNDHLTVSTQAYELALMIRQAQMYSLGVREDVGGNGDKFRVGYGINFDYDNLNQYIFFADRDGDKRYDSGELIELKDLKRNVVIDKICGVKDVGQEEERCAPNGGGIGNVVELNVSFYRPDTGANIVFFNNENGLSNNVTSPGKIYLRSLGGKQSVVKIESNGQVSVDDL